MNLFELFIKIGVDDQASDNISSLSSKLGNGLATAAKVGTAAVTAASGAIAALTKASIDGYADYEQLVGGAKLMFGDAYDFISEKAKNAYSTVQMSQNDYLQQVNGFATGLKTALDGNAQAAAELADRIINAEADVVAATGNSQEAVQNAFNGIMKSNYTMLDNLQLGITPTKEGFQEVIDKVNEWNAANGKATNYVIDNLADAQSALVDYIEMQGLQGYAANEAADTIQGSLASMKGAWKNLVTGIADDNADLDTLIWNFVDTVAIAGENIIPRVEQILNGIGTAVTKLAPVISEAVPELVTNVLPALLDAGVQLIDGLLQGLITALPAFAESSVSIVDTLATTIVEQLPALMEAAMEVIVTLANGIAESLPELIPTIVDVVIQIVETLIDNVDMLVDASVEIIIALAEGIINALPALIGKAPEIIAKLVDALITNAPKLLAAALTLIVTLANGLITNIPQLIKAIPQIVSAIVKGFTAYMPQIKDIGKNIVNGIWEGISAMSSWITSKVNSFVSGIVSGVKGVLGIKSPSKVFASIGGYMAEGLGEGWEGEYSSVKKQIEDGMNFGAATVDFASSGVGQYTGAMQSAFGEIAASINQNATIVVQSVLDGKVIGETAYQYSRNKQRAYGV